MSALHPFETMVRRARGVPVPQRAPVDGERSRRPRARCLSRRMHASRESTGDESAPGFSNSTAAAALMTAARSVASVTALRPAAPLAEQALRALPGVGVLVFDAALRLVSVGGEACADPAVTRLVGGGVDGALPVELPPETARRF